jgi:hypothetical protein
MNYMLQLAISVDVSEGGIPSTGIAQKECVHHRNISPRRWVYASPTT